MDKTLKEKKESLEETLGNTVIKSRYGINHDRYIVVEQPHPRTHRDKFKLFMAKQIRHEGRLELEYLDLGYIDIVFTKEN